MVVGLGKGRHTKILFLSAQNSRNEIFWFFRDMSGQWMQDTFGCFSNKGTCKFGSINHSSLSFKLVSFLHKSSNFQAYADFSAHPASCIVTPKTWTRMPYCCSFSSTVFLVSPSSFWGRRPGRSLASRAQVVKMPCALSSVHHAPTARQQSR